MANATVESTLSAYTTGEADYLAFLDTERTRFEIGLAAADARHRLLLAAAALYRALGETVTDEALPDAPHHR